MGFFSELKERRIVQIVVSFAAAGWIGLEAVDQVVDRGILPEVAYQVALIWYLGGLIGSTIVGWYHGEKGRQDVTRGEMSLLALLTTGVLVWSGLTVADEIGQGPDRAELEAAGLALDRVSVLYFQDVSSDADLQHVADGLTESLIDRISGVSALDVVSRNGAARFRGSELQPDSIARILGSGTLVRGSVEESGDQLRVTVRLIDGASGSELRRRSFTEPAGELLAIRDALAEEVGLLLREWLGEEIDIRRARGETESVAAWALLQRAQRARRESRDLRQQGAVDQSVQALERADSLYQRAAALDATWADPLVGRAEVALVRARMAARGNRTEARAWFERGLERANRALEVAPRSATAYQARGELHYYRWVYGVSPDPSQRQTAFEAAKRDLESAVRLDASLAEAWSRLSVIRSQETDNVGAKLAAQRAYEQDAFLQSARSVLWHLYRTSYDLEQFQDAVQYCEEGRRRFPETANFVECRLWLLASPALEANVEEAWQVYDRYVELTPTGSRERVRMKGQILVAWVLARTNQLDSAQAVLDEVDARPSVDPSLELLGFKALVQLEMDNEEGALSLLRRYLTASPDHREGWRWTGHWWWRDLQDNPEFQDLVGAG